MLTVDGLITQAPEGLRPPFEYGLLWPVLGVLTFAVIAVGFFLVFYQTRYRKPVVNGIMPIAPRQLPGLRQKYWGRIDRIIQEFDAGRLSERAAHQGLSLAVRGYTQESSGIPAERMTLAELQRSGVHLTSEAIAVYYPAEFAQESPTSVYESAQIARSVVGG